MNDCVKALYTLFLVSESLLCIFKSGHNKDTKGIIKKTWNPNSIYNYYFYNKKIAMFLDEYGQFK